MIKYDLKINNGVEAFGTSGKTITAEQRLEVCGADELATALSKNIEVVSPRTCKFVVDYLLETILEKMAEGKMVILPMDGKAALRVYPDVHLATDSISEDEARALDPSFTEITLENISDIVSKSGGVVCSIKAAAERYLTNVFRKMNPVLKLAGKREVPRLLRKETVVDNGGDNNGGNGGNNNGGGSDDGTLG